jgi:GTPase SAR1 family protein
VMADGLQTAEKVRILVLGDSGVGKTSLVELVCSGAELRKPRSTVGCAIHMKIHESRSTVAPAPSRAAVYGSASSLAEIEQRLRRSRPELTQRTPLAQGKHCFVEFWDIGGSERFKESRHVSAGVLVCACG